MTRRSCSRSGLPRNGHSKERATRRSRTPLIDCAGSKESDVVWLNRISTLRMWVAPNPGGTGPQRQYHWSSSRRILSRPTIRSRTSQGVGVIMGVIPEAAHSSGHAQNGGMITGAAYFTVRPTKFLQCWPLLPMECPARPLRIPDMCISDFMLFSVDILRFTDLKSYEHRSP